MRSEWLFHSASSLARRLPLPAAYAIADLTAALAPVLSRRRAGAARANIEALSPWLEPPRDPRALLRSAFRSHHRLVVEFLRASALPLERVDEAVEFRGLDNLRNALAPGRGVILVTTHVGNWEVVAIALHRMRVPVHSGRRRAVPSPRLPGRAPRERARRARAPRPRGPRRSSARFARGMPSCSISTADSSDAAQRSRSSGGPHGSRADRSCSRRAPAPRCFL